MSPVWSRDGTELFYLNVDREVVAARVTTEPSFRVLSQEVLFPLGPEYRAAPVIPVADVTSDGLFLMMRRVEASASLVLIYNFAEYLKQRVPN